jgi:Icc-related predicted phosphoesterase
MAKFIFAGDPHGDFSHMLPAVEAFAPDALILLGDQQAQQPLHVELAAVMALTQVWWIPGNHDTDSPADHDNLWGSEPLADRNLHGRVVEIAGVRIAGLGGVFRGQIWMPDAEPSYTSQPEYLAKAGKGNRWQGGMPLKHRSTIFPAEVDRLARQRADILVTHEAPGCHHHGFAALSELARSMRVKTAFHGHHHEALDYPTSLAELGFQARGVGFRQLYMLDTETEFEGS